MVQMPTNVQIYKSNRHIAYSSLYDGVGVLSGGKSGCFYHPVLSCAFGSTFQLLVRRKTLCSLDSCIQMNSLALIAGVFFSLANTTFCSLLLY